MDCFKCRKGSRVVDSKKTAERITRRRECLGCGLRWNTTEYRDHSGAKQKPAAVSAVKPAEVKPRLQRRRQREELFDLREGGYDSELNDILDDLGV